MSEMVINIISGIAYLILAWRRLSAAFWPVLTAKFPHACSAGLDLPLCSPFTIFSNFGINSLWR